MKRRQGFTIIEGIIIAAIVIVLVGATWYVINARSKKSDNNTATTTNTTDSNKTTATSQADEETAAKAAAKDHFSLVYAKKTEEAYKVTCQGFKDNTSYDDFSTTLEQGNFYKIDLSAIEYTSVEVKNGQGKISGAIGPLQPNSDMHVNLLKENGKWCVYGYQVK